MAFDMYLGEKREAIEYYEEGLFSIVSEDERFPKLNWLWENFYNGPRIEPNVSNEIVHELIQVRTVFLESGDKTSLKCVDRLLPFFSESYKTDTQVRCASD